MKISILVATLLLGTLTAFPTWAEPNKQNPRSGVRTDDEKRKDLEGTDVEVVDSSEGYWLNRGLNETLYGANGSFNSVRLERNQARTDEALSKIYKAPTVVEVTVNGRVLKSPTPPLKMNGKVVDTAPRSNP